MRSKSRIHCDLQSQKPQEHGGDPTDESTTNLLTYVQFSSGKRPSAGDKFPRADIIWGLSLK